MFGYLLFQWTFGAIDPIVGLTLSLVVVNSAVYGVPNNSHNSEGKNFGCFKDSPRGFYRKELSTNKVPN